MSFLQNIIKVVPFIYANFITNINFVKYSINSIYVYDIFKNRNQYFNNILNNVLNAKIKITNLIKDKFYNKNQKFQLQNAELYTNLVDKYSVLYYIKNNNIDKIDNDLINKMIEHYNIKYNDNEDIRLKIYFKYESCNYILYYSYKNKFSNKLYIPYPPYNEEILDNYRKDIIKPYHIEGDKKNILYSLFNMESKDIDSISLDCDLFNYDHLIEYIKMIHGPFNDFGLLYNCPIKLKWILSENNIDIDRFKSLTIKFLNMYFDEDKMDLFEHKIELTKEKIDEIVISYRMKYILSQKDKFFSN